MIFSIRRPKFYHFIYRAWPLGRTGQGPTTFPSGGFTGIALSHRIGFNLNSLFKSSKDLGIVCGVSKFVTFHDIKLLVNGKISFSCIGIQLPCNNQYCISDDL